MSSKIMGSAQRPTLLRIIRCMMKAANPRMAKHLAASSGIVAQQAGNAVAPRAS
jgi:hypothetical protein